MRITQPRVPSPPHARQEREAAMIKKEGTRTEYTKSKTETKRKQTKTGPKKALKKQKQKKQTNQGE